MKTQRIIISLIFPILFMNCERHTNRENIVHRDECIRYLEYNVMSSLKHSGTLVNNIDFISRFDTVKVAELFSIRDKLLFIHLSGLYSSDCNRKILSEVKNKLKNIPESDVIVFATNMNQREAFVSYGN